MTEPSETYRVAATTRTKTPTMTRTAQGERTANDPTAVATPFPPRNPKKSGKTWPRIAATAAAPSQRGSYVTVRIRRTAATPFRMSSAATVRASGFPDVRRTFVPPALPEPTVRMSMPLVSRTRIVAKVSEPRR